QHRLGVHLKPPGGGAKAQPFSQTGQHAHDQFHRQAFTMPERAVRLQEVAVTRATVQLAPQATAGMAVGVEVAEDVSQVSIPDHRACPNSYRLMKSPITRSCMHSVLEKHSVRRTNRLIRVRRLMCLLSIFCVCSLPT